MVRIVVTRGVSKGTQGGTLGVAEDAMKNVDFGNIQQR